MFYACREENRNMSGVALLKWFLSSADETKLDNESEEYKTPRHSRKCT